MTTRTQALLSIVVELGLNVRTLRINLDDEPYGNAVAEVWIEHKMAKASARLVVHGDVLFRAVVATAVAPRKTVRRLECEVKDATEARRLAGLLDEGQVKLFDRIVDELARLIKGGASDDAA